MQNSCMTNSNAYISLNSRICTCPASPTRVTHPLSQHFHEVLKLTLQLQQPKKKKKKVFSQGRELFIFELEVTNKKLGVAQVFIAGKKWEAEGVLRRGGGFYREIDRIKVKRDKKS